MSAQTVERRAGPAPRLPRAERRTSARFLCNLESSCRALAAGRGEPWPATVRALSAEGASVVLRRRFESGVLLGLELAEAGVTRLLLVRVVHATALAGGNWLLGCKFFSPLEEDDLRSLLAGAGQAE